MPSPVVPRRFRTRLAGAFVLLAAVISGVLALGSFLTIKQHRERVFVHHAEDAARLGLLSRPGQLSLEGFEELLGEFRSQAGFETVAIVGDVVYSSTAAISRDDIPRSLLEPPPPGDLASEATTVGAIPYLVVAGVPRTGTNRLYFFFDRRDLIESLRQFRNVLAVGWLGAVAGAALVGSLVARRTLRPVAHAAEAAASIADGLLETRLPASTDDEFGAWAQSFNRMAEALEEKIKALSDAAERERRFTADVAHELRTPLTAMSSAASMLGEELDGLRPEGRQLAQILIDDVRRLEALVAELLELARLDAGQGDVNIEVLSVAQAVNAVLTTWDGEVQLCEATGPDLAVLADRFRFRRVVSNLVANAVEHGGGRAEVVWRRDGDMVALDVLDRGPGIEGEVDHVFRRFHKGDAARTRGGAGLGLAIALEHARAQAGSLEVANRSGGGTRFTFRLPAAPPGNDQVTPSAIGAATPSGRGHARSSYRHETDRSI